MKVAIIGGGFTGVACATNLALQGVQVSLFEKNEHLGGLAGGFDSDNWTSSLEYYYHHWFKSDAFVTRYLHTWNLAHNIKFERPLTCMETDSHGFVQLDSPVSLLRYPEISFFSRLRMGIVLAYIKTIRNWRNLEKVTARLWCERAMGVAGFEAIWLPLLRGKFGLSWMNHVNMAWFWARLACRTPELGTYKGGFQKLFDDVELWLKSKNVEVNTGTKRIEIHREGNKWVVNSALNGLAKSELFDKVIIAAGPSAFTSLCGQFAPEYSKLIAARPSLGAQVVILSLKKGIGSYYWYNLKKSENKPFLALIEHTNFVSKSNFGNEHIVYLADYIDTNSMEWQRTNEELVALATATCTRVNAAISPADLNKSWVFREPYAQPVVGVNASQNIPPISVAEAPNLFHGSMAHIYPWDRGTNFALELGCKLAEAVKLE